MIFAKSLGLQLGIFVGTVVGRQASSHTQQLSLDEIQKCNMNIYPQVMTYYYCMTYSPILEQYTLAFHMKIV